MRSSRRVFFTAFVTAVFTSVAQTPQGIEGGRNATNVPAFAAAITGQSMTSSYGFTSLKELCDRIGGRVTGSKQDAQARQWALQKMKEAGLSNIHEEEWQLDTRWTREYASAELIA